MLHHYKTIPVKSPATAIFEVLKVRWIPGSTGSFCFVYDF